ncbi:hypothetical protein ACW9HQ_53260, partial [Nocardia gipuzkoensis]
MAQPYRNTLRSHAYQLWALGRSFGDLATRHRSAASSIESNKLRRLTADSHFTDWIVRTAEFSAAAERLLALEIELARSFGVTWDEVAAALGVSRQAAWERFSKPSRWNRSRTMSQLQRTRRAELIRELRQRIATSDEEVLA